MHILVVNDDGPPSSRLSPYIRPFVGALEEAGHTVSVAIPATSRSWIGKAHLIEFPLVAAYVRPDAFRDDGSWVDFETTSAGPDRDLQAEPGSGKEWVVVTNGTPASCTQLGLFNLFPDRGPIDLVVSGPNHGRNASTIYNLSSGTVGGALEAATCGKRGIAVSFGSKDEQSIEVIRAASRLTVKVIEHLWRNWDERVELYNLNVPMRLDVETRPVQYTQALSNYWSKGSLYAEVVDNRHGHALVSNGNAVDCIAAEKPPPLRNGSVSLMKERHFKWCTELSDIQKSLHAAHPGIDAHAVLNGCTSVTPLLANFWHIPGLEGELIFDD